MFWKKVLVNVACNSLVFLTSKSNLVDEVKDISASKIPSIMELQKLKD